MVVVLLLPVALILAVCLLERLERAVVARPPTARSPVARPTPVAAVVPLHGGPTPEPPILDGPTLRLRRTA